MARYPQGFDSALTQNTEANQTLVDENYIRQGMQLPPVRESFSRLTVVTNMAVAASGNMLAVGIPLQAGDIITNLTFVTGTTAAVAPTAGFVALYDTTATSATPALLAQSADFGATARAASTSYTIPLTQQVTIKTAGLYYAAFSMTVTTTMPTLRGIVPLGTVINGSYLGMPMIAATAAGAFGGVAPATFTMAVNSNCLYMVAS